MSNVSLIRSRLSTAATVMKPLAASTSTTPQFQREDPEMSRMRGMISAKRANFTGLSYQYELATGQIQLFDKDEFQIAAARWQATLSLYHSDSNDAFELSCNLMKSLIKDPSMESFHDEIADYLEHHSPSC